MRTQALIDGAEMSTGLYRLLSHRFSRTSRPADGPREVGTGRRLKSALVALTVAAVLLVGTGAWLVIWVDDSESADDSSIRVAGEASSPAGALGQASANRTANQPTTDQTAGNANPTTVGVAVQGGAATVPASAGQKQANAVPEPTASEDKAVASLEPPAVSGLRISSQSWRRGGLGSKALVTFTLRNDNSYPVKDFELACAFSRRDGSHLTDRTRMVPGPVGMKSRKTFTAVHVGFVNVNASKARCTLVAASKI
jgi:uncharacterized membrane protein